MDSNRLLFDLHQANEIAQDFAGHLDAAAIARCTTEGLVARFNCAFARIWLVEADRTSLRLVASSGLYTRLDGAFARVPMGAYKVGKIAQNRVSFLSNNLAEETWVKDREWAIANRIRGFAGFPLVVRDRVIGVLASFSHHPLTPEFLEVLQILCTLVAITLETALEYERSRPIAAPPPASHPLALSDQLASLLSSVRLTLIGTEKPLPLSHSCLMLQLGEALNRSGCRYCRLLYQPEGVVLEAIATLPPGNDPNPPIPGLLPFLAAHLGGSLTTEPIAEQKGLQVKLALPYSPIPLSPPQLQIQCRQPLLQFAFTHLAQAAGLPVSQHDPTLPLLTDDPSQVTLDRPILWVRQGNEPIPAAARGCLDLSATPDGLQAALVALGQGQTWGLEAPTLTELPLLSEREREILALLSEGLRDRDVAHHLVISESTVKFHVNNALAKLKARTRFQALHTAIKRGWL